MLDIARKLKRKLKKDDVLDRCGLVLADGTVFAVNNQHENPEAGFRISGPVMLTHEADLVGAWHTHPGKPSTLSQEDYHGFLSWPDLTHFIVGTDGVRAYRVEDGIVREVDLAAD